MDKEKPISIECADIYLRFPEVMEEEFDDLTEFLEDEHIRYEGATDIFIDLQNKVKKQKEVIDKIKEWEQNHTILVYTKEAPRMLVGTHELLHILYEDKEVSE